VVPGKASQGRRSGEECPDCEGDGLTGVTDEDALIICEKCNGVGPILRRHDIGRV
jgi:DnaJ-class molecular chaperone